jgi:hypothetical protein
MRFFVRFGRASLFFAACAVLWTSPAMADEGDARERSIALFKEGVAAGKAGEYVRAEAAFRNSYALRPSSSTLRNWALTEMRLGKMVEALGHLKVALKAPGWTAEQRSIVQQNFDDAYAATGHLAIRTTEGARVAVDGVLADGAAPLDDPLDVLPGRRRVEARLGRQVTHADVEAPAGQVVHVDLPVAPATPEAPAPSPTLAEQTSASRQEVHTQAAGDSRATTWWTTPHAGAVALASVGAMGLGLGLYFDAHSNALASDVSSLRSALVGRCTGPAPATDCAVLRDKIAAVGTNETLAEVAFAASAAAAVGAAALLTLVGPGAVARTGSVQWGPRIAPGAAGIAGAF